MDKLLHKTTKFATFYYYENDNCLIEELSKYLDEEAANIFKFFNLKATKQKLIIKIVPTKEQYDKQFLDRHTNFSKDFVVPKYARGEFFEKENAIYYLSFADYINTSHYNKNQQQQLEDYKKTLLHEFVHYANKLFNEQNNNGWTSKYLIEGIAIYLSKQKENKKINFDFTIEDVLEIDMRKTKYDVFYLLTKYLVENYDKEFVLDLFTSSNQSKRFLENELFNKAKECFSGKII